MQCFRVTLQARNPLKGCFRAYQITAGQDMFGVWIIDIAYGRIGTRGNWIRYSAADEAAARKLVRLKLNRRATAHRRIGVAYRICELEDPDQWIRCDSHRISCVDDVFPPTFGNEFNEKFSLT